MPHRPERLAEMIRDELTELIEGELADPRVGLAAITGVALPAPGRVAQVRFQVEGDEREQRLSLQGLIAASSFLRAQVGLRLQIRHMPELRFVLDRSRQDTARIEELLHRSRSRQHRQQERDTPPAPHLEQNEGEQNG
ncbi:MAG TPA: 30S ribosome-binding factor RbfA [Terriglobales bacterium]|nr:30S ribosome-binding factor RbfA [Terriglobales bacterium]